MVSAKNGRNTCLRSKLNPFIHFSCRSSCAARNGCDEVVDNCPDPNQTDEPDSSFMPVPGPLTVINFEGDSQSYTDILAESSGWMMSSFENSTRMTNIVDDSDWGIKQDLVLKVDLAEPSTIKLQARIDIGDGYETFALFVDGQQRNTYGQRITDNTGEPTWLTVLTAMNAGKHVITLSVIKAASRPEMFPRDYPIEGSGSVWVDDIEIYNT